MRHSKLNIYEQVRLGTWPTVSGRWAVQDDSLLTQQIVMHIQGEYRNRTEAGKGNMLLHAYRVSREYEINEKREQT